MRNRSIFLTLLLVIAGAAMLRAQMSQGGTAAAGGANPISADAKRGYDSIKDILMKSAEKMPAENYSFRTTPQAFQHIGILSLEFHVDKLSRPLL